MTTLITTAISYTNGPPHIGHLYEAVLGDFVKNLYLISGAESKLLTGTDEHGKKIEETAKSKEITPKQLCDKHSSEFKQLNDKLKNKYDYFIRTTDKNHIELVQKCLYKAKETNDIYLDTYEGWYCVREESFVSELECKLNNFKDPITEKPYELIKEDTYYFRLSKYKDKIIDYVNKLKIHQYVKDDIISKLEELKDLSISRTSFNWGIKFPFDEKHVVYVWFDALLNYITGHKILFDKPAQTVHIIGKDIVWFHIVIYPAILFSLGLDEYLSYDVLIHGFVMDKNGVKMSKSLGNTVDVNYVLEKYNLEAVRYYLISNTVIGEDINFSEEQLVAQYNNELIKSFGNLFQRLYKLLIPHQIEINDLLSSRGKCFSNKEIIEILEDGINIKRYVKLIQTKLAEINKRIQDEKPWEKKEGKVQLLAELLIELNTILIYMYPIIPNKVNELRGYLGISEITRKNIDQSIVINIKDNNIKAFNIIK